MTLYVKRHDTRTAIKATLFNPRGEEVNLTDAVVKFIMVKRNKITINRDVDIIDGVVCVVFTKEEISELGMFKAEFEVTYSDNSVETFPNSGYISINIIADLA